MLLLVSGLLSLILAGTGLFLYKLCSLYFRYSIVNNKMKGLLEQSRAIESLPSKEERAAASMRWKIRRDEILKGGKALENLLERMLS